MSRQGLLAGVLDGFLWTLVVYTYSSKGFLTYRRARYGGRASRFDLPRGWTFP